jgi:hypothetical protein
MASWAPPLRANRPRRTAPEPRRLRPDPGVLRLGRHVVSDRDIVLLAERLGDLEHLLAADPPRTVEETGAAEALRAARARVARDLELVSTARERAHRPAD